VSDSWHERGAPETGPDTATAGLALEDDLARPDVSILVVEERNPATMDELYREYGPPLTACGKTCEFLFVTGHGETAFADQVREGGRTRPGSLRVLEVGQAMGDSAKMRVAVEKCRGATVVTLPSSFRIDPQGIVRLVEAIDAGADVAVARRSPRHDNWFNRLQVRFINGLLNLLTGSVLKDITCRVSALRREVLSELPLYGDYFRFLPVVAEREGFRVEQVEVGQHERDGGARIYRLGTYLGWLIDILGIFFLLRFMYRPLRFFGLVGATFGLAGAAILATIFVQRLQGQGVADRPLLLLGVLLFTLGVQSIALGLVGEIVVHFQAARGLTYRLAAPDPEPDV